MITNNDPLIKEKQDLIRKIDSIKDPGEKEETAKRIGEINKILLENAKNNIEKTLKETKKTLPKTVPKIHDQKSLRKIMRLKYDFYKQTALDARELYAKAVNKKQDSKRIAELIADPKKLQEATSEVLKY